MKQLSSDVLMIHEDFGLLDLGAAGFALEH